MRREPPTGLRRLRRHVAQRRGWLALLLGGAIVQAFAQSGSWLLVRLAINEGIVPHDEPVLLWSVAAYATVAVVGWVLMGIVMSVMGGVGAFSFHLWRHARTPLEPHQELTNEDLKPYE